LLRDNNLSSLLLLLTQMLNHGVTSVDSGTIGWLKQELLSK